MSLFKSKIFKYNAKNRPTSLGWTKGHWCQEEPQCIIFTSLFFMPFEMVAAQLAAELTGKIWTTDRTSASRSGGSERVQHQDVVSKGDISKRSKKLIAAQLEQNRWSSKEPCTRSVLGDLSTESWQTSQGTFSAVWTFLIARAGAFSAFFDIYKITLFCTSPNWGILQETSNVLVIFASIFAIFTIIF